MKLTKSYLKKIITEIVESTPVKIMYPRQTVEKSIVKNVEDALEKDIKEQLKFVVKILERAVEPEAVNRAREHLEDNAIDEESFETGIQVAEKMLNFCRETVFKLEQDEIEGKMSRQDDEAPSIFLEYMSQLFKGQIAQPANQLQMAGLLNNEDKWFLLRVSQNTRDAMPKEKAIPQPTKRLQPY